MPRGCLLVCVLLLGGACTLYTPPTRHQLVRVTGGQSGGGVWAVMAWVDDEGVTCTELDDGFGTSSTHCGTNVRGEPQGQQDDFLTWAYGNVGPHRRTVFHGIVARE